MRKSFVEVMKEICEDEGISLQQLSKILKVTKKELEEYLSGQKKPNLEFMAKFCKEFDLSLDYFLKSNMRECMTDDLVVVKNSRGKYAIFDVSQGAYLTEYLYDIIDISPSGKHIVRKKQTGDWHYKEIIIDNKGDQYQLSDFRLLCIGNVFQNGVYNQAVPIQNSGDEKIFFIDVNGRVLSKGYAYISSLTNISSFECFENPQGGFELFWGGIADKNGNITSSVLVGKNGKEVKLKLEKNYYEEEKNSVCPRAYIMPELDTIEKAVAALKKYGKTIVTYLPKEIFVNQENYYILANELYKYAVKELRNGESYKSVSETLKLVLNTMNNLLHIYVKDVDERFIESLDLVSIIGNLRSEYYKIKKDKISKLQQI